MFAAENYEIERKEKWETKYSDNVNLNSPTTFIFFLHSLYERRQKNERRWEIHFMLSEYTLIRPRRLFLSINRRLVQSHGSGRHKYDVIDYEFIY